MRVVATLGEAVSFYKLGLELFMAGGYFDLMNRLVDQGKKVMVDLKFSVPYASYTATTRSWPPRPARRGRSGILAVTVLTSLDQGDLTDLGFQCEVEALVLSRARRALALGCDGVVSSGLEAERLRESLGDRLLIVIPGIRPVANTDDQKRTVDVEQAFRNGADDIVVGRRDPAMPRTRDRQRNRSRRGSPGRALPPPSPPSGHRPGR